MIEFFKFYDSLVCITYHFTSILQAFQKCQKTQKSLKSQKVQKILKFQKKSKNVKYLNISERAYHLVVLVLS